MYDGDQTPEGILLPQEEEGYGGQSVEALAVADGCVIPAEGHQDSAQLVDLRSKGEALVSIHILYRVSLTC